MFLTHLNKAQSLSLVLEQVHKSIHQDLLGVAMANHDTSIKVSMHLIVLWSPQGLPKRLHSLDHPTHHLHLIRP
jgi:hypothetical protein